MELKWVFVSKSWDSGEWRQTINAKLGRLSSMDHKVTNAVGSVNLSGEKGDPRGWQVSGLKSEVRDFYLERERSASKAYFLFVSYYCYLFANPNAWVLDSSPLLPVTFWVSCCCGCPLSFPRNREHKLLSAWGLFPCLPFFSTPAYCQVFL